ncbi:Cell division protein FtsQ [Cardinium endosymbiont of Sogatella furcifera]|uniref:cell division protein FtsQ/DivIB n=1 Tax=Cardinium endosymbiont of Sogatella furcifera TaxID=650378 RepID=UPI000E0D8177|nr:hypothetical protein [Cardinium endosymbiont of Sogatella furcifera]AXI24050.1 Cell division protein FtsQ [Cardinium endosymbiont of Sogatella furcifera]
MGQTAKSVVSLFLTVGLCVSLLFVGKKHATLLCEAIEISIKEEPGQSFITPKEVMNCLASTYKISLQKTPLKNIHTHAIQHHLASHPFIKNVWVYKTWQGILKICLETKYCIARIINRTEPNEVYLDEAGCLLEAKGLPLLRLLIITGQNIGIANNTLRDKGLLALLHFIYKHPFWKRQITSLEVTAHGKIILGTQVGGHQITFGKAENIDEKFEKLWLFYTQVIPYKGWKAYHLVNVEFDNQLICE